MYFTLSLLIIFVAVAQFTVGQTSSPTAVPTVAVTRPTVKPTLRPTRAPSFRPKDNSIYTDYAPTETLTPDEQQGIVATVTVLLFILMATEITSPEVLFLIALVIMILTEILTINQGLAGFSNQALITIGSLFLVVGAVEKSHVVDWMARRTFGVTGSVTVGKLRMFFSCFLLSIFFNNTPLVAILLPVVKDWGRMRGVGASQLLMPLSYAVLAGSFGSMIGTSTNLTIQGLMQADRNFSFPFFAPLPIGVVCFAALLVYMLLAGPFLLPTNRSGLIREARDNAKSLIEEVLESESSPAVGKSVESFASSLGVAPSSIIKIRRLERPAGINAEETEKRESVSRLSNAFDYKYLRKAASFWNLPNKQQPDSNDAVDSNIPSTEDLSNNESNRSDRQYVDIVAPPAYELIGANDIVFLSSAQDAVEKMMKSILGESKGLKILHADVLALPGFGSEVLECVISDQNPFLGKKVSEMATAFADRYQAALITVRGREWGNLFGEEEGEGKDSADKTTNNNNSGNSEGSPTLKAATTRGSIKHQPLSIVYDDIETQMVELNSNEEKSDDEQSNHSQQKEIEMTQFSYDKVMTKDSEDQEDIGLVSTVSTSLEIPSISEHIVTLGDVVLCVTNEKHVRDLSRNKDFFVVSPVGSLPKPLTLYGLIPVVCFFAMLVCVAVELIDICPASLTLAAFFFMGGWIKPEDIPVFVDLRLLMLLGTSLSFATSMTTSGLAARVAQTISEANPSPFGALLLVYALTLVITELISNNAAAALMYPIAVGLADELGVSFKTFAMAVLVSSTAGFMSPIGYQTHVMVWGPGGYRFRDFILFGIVPDIIYWFLGCAVIVAMYPF